MNKSTQLTLLPPTLWLSHANPDRIPKLRLQDYTIHATALLLIQASWRTGAGTGNLRPIRALTTKAR